MNKFFRSIKKYILPQQPALIVLSHGLNSCFHAQPTLKNQKSIFGQNVLTYCLSVYLNDIVSKSMKIKGS